MVCGPKGATVTPNMCTFENGQLYTINYEIDKFTTAVYNHLDKTFSITRKGDENNGFAINAK
jgi:hypothetical protein